MSEKRESLKVEASETRPATDREVLLFAYGALKAIKHSPPDVVARIEEHLFPENKGEKK